jgi:hypothetical protein
MLHGTIHRRHTVTIGIMCPQQVQLWHLLELVHVRYACGMRVACCVWHACVKLCNTPTRLRGALIETGTNNLTWNKCRCDGHQARRQLLSQGHCTAVHELRAPLTITCATGCCSKQRPLNT